jgi:hypothetical protein
MYLNSHVFVLQRKKIVKLERQVTVILPPEAAYFCNSKMYGEPTGGREVHPADILKTTI